MNLNYNLINTSSNTDKEVMIVDIKPAQMGDGAAKFWCTNISQQKELYMKILKGTPIILRWKFINNGQLSIIWFYPMNINPIYDGDDNPTIKNGHIAINFLDSSYIFDKLSDSEDLDIRPLLILHADADEHSISYQYDEQTDTEIEVPIGQQYNINIDSDVNEDAFYQYFGITDYESYMNENK